MAKISLKYVKMGTRLYLCALVCGAGIRHYKIVPFVGEADLTGWDVKSQLFDTTVDGWAKKNIGLAEMKESFEKFQQEFDFKNGKELFAYAQTGKRKPGRKPDTEFEPPKPPRKLGSPTLGEWLLKIIADFKNPKRLKPSSSYQPYGTLWRHLKREGTLINTPLTDINDDSFIQLAKWVNGRKTAAGKGNNFIGIMKIFRAAISKAHKAKLTDYVPDFPYMDYASTTYALSDKASDVLANGGTVKSLTPTQYDWFENADLSAIKLKGLDAEHRELYRDYCVFLYELKSRPVDVLKLHWDNIAKDPVTGRYTCTYIPAKKKNYGAGQHHTSSALVVQYLTDKAANIAMKYKGLSKGGYVFPFFVNERRWDLSKPDDFHRYYYKANATCGKINKFLHRIGAEMGLPFQLTIYAFRRTAITKAVMENRIPLPIIAKMAGTSVDMIDKHYTNYLHTLAVY